MSKPKLTGQQEIFAREFVRFGVGAVAYRKAFRVRETTKPDSVYQAASKLLADPKIASRVEALREQAAKRAGVTRETMLLEMSENRALAIDDRQYGVAQSASRDRAKVAGLMSDDLTKMGDIHIHFAAELKSVL